MGWVRRSYPNLCCLMLLFQLDTGDPMNTNTQLLTTLGICEKLAISRPTLWRRRKNDPNFPQPIYIGVRTVRFRLADVEAYIESLVTKGANNE